MKPINVVFFLIFFVAGLVLATIVYAVNQPLGVLVGIAAFFGAIFLSGAIKIADQWERIVVLRLGKFLDVKGPGVCIIVPVIDRAIFVDTRILTLDIPKQQVITK